MKHYFKIVILFLARYVLRVLWLFPVKRNRILFVAFEGRTYGCNPKYIFKWLQSHSGDSYEYIWCLNAGISMPDGAHAVRVKFLSPRYLYYLFTSGVVINNYPVEPFFTKRKGQLVIHTHHGGGCYKKGIMYASRSKISYWNYTRKSRVGQMDYTISSCKAFTDNYHTIFSMNPQRFLPIGMPRNDLFFSSKRESLKIEIVRKLTINSGKKIILYAPTYRGWWRSPEISCVKALDVEAVCAAVCRRFGGDTVFLWRLHPLMKNMGVDCKTHKEIDVSDYADMQELLLAADIFITDYSSALWDYSFTGNPGFLFTPDLEEYERTTGLYTPIDLWPYPYAKDSEQLCSLILNYNEEAALKRIREHHQLLGSYENGTATESVSKIIEEHTMNSF